MEALEAEEEGGGEVVEVEALENIWTWDHRSQLSVSPMFILEMHRCSCVADLVLT